MSIGVFPARKPRRVRDRKYLRPFKQFEREYREWQAMMDYWRMFWGVGRANPPRGK